MSRNEFLEEKENPNTLLAEPENTGESLNAEPEETVVPEENLIPKENEMPEETTVPEEIAEPEESAISEENMKSEESVILEDSIMSEERTESQATIKEDTMESSLLLGFLGIVIGVLASFFAFYVMSKRKKYMHHREDKETDLALAMNKRNVKITKVARNCPVKIVSIHGVGRRNSQQDSFGISDVKENTDFEQKGVLAIVADGMGGLSDGDRMSQMVVVSMLRGFDEEKVDLQSSSSALLLKLVREANEEVTDELGEEKLGKCGSTVTAVLVKEQKLSWISVGDSRIYVYRKGKLIKLNQEHNYAAELDAMVENGELTEEEAMSNPQRGALTSFIGMGVLEMIDQNEIPIALEKNDRILLMSDGIFGTISEKRIAELMDKPLLQACNQIELEINEINKRNQDNYTCVVLEVN